MTPFQESIARTQVAATIRAELLQFIYEPTKLHFEKQIEAIGHKNAVLNFSTNPVFIYKGKTFNYASPLPYVIPLLGKELRPAMDDLLKEMGQVLEWERNRVFSFIAGCINRATTTEEFIAMLPESLHTYAIKFLKPTAYTPIPEITKPNQLEYINQYQDLRDTINNRCALNILI